MNIEITQKDGIATMSIEGRIDTVTAKEFEVKMNELLALSCNEMIADCSGMTYISSSGLRGFLILQKSANAKGATLVLKHLSDPIKEVFKITGFASIFKIED